MKRYSVWHVTATVINLSQSKILDEEVSVRVLVHEGACPRQVMDLAETVEFERSGPKVGTIERLRVHRVTGLGRQELVHAVRL